jgi:long-chain acyl-CoA synthetase
MPVFYQSLGELTDVAAIPNLRLCISAGAPLTPEIALRFEEKFGGQIHSFYGSSECGGICYVHQPRAIAGYVGEPICGVEIGLLENGGIKVRSGAVGDGYFPDSNLAVLGGGAFFPDDLLEKIDGGFRIVGRVSDLINVAGKKVNPPEVEAAIVQHAGVRQAIVFGRESARRNQEVVACVVAKAGVYETELLAHCRARLSSWQVPRRIYFVEELPANERGKTSRRDLAMRFRGSD